VAQAGDTTQVLALSSGFMAYPPDIHPKYAAIRQELLASPRSFVLLPSLERETCVAETVRRQRTRPFARSAEREEQVIRARFPLYRSLPLPSLGTMRPAAQVAADIASRIASDPAQGAA
jgi:shikimate kinase